MCGERACPALGRAAAPIKNTEFLLKELGVWIQGCFAAQRRASLLATTSPLTTFDAAVV
jgi:hypothetical protein